MSEPKKWHLTKNKRTKWRSYGFRTENMGGFHAHFFLSGLFLKMKTTKEEKGIQADTAISSPTNPVPTSCMKAYYTQKTKNDT